MQIVDGDSLQEKAVDQWTREIPVIAERGTITDRNGVVLASNDDTYSIFIRKNAVSDLRETVNVLSGILNVDPEALYKKVSGVRASEFTVAKQVKKEAINQLSGYSLEGVYFSRDNTRLYTYGDFLAQTLGFTGSDGSGQAGLELLYDKYLRGVDGEILYETDIVGNRLNNSVATYKPAVAGLNVRLTVDSEIQLLAENVAEKAIAASNAKSVQILVTNPGNGEILAMCNKPSYNLNEVPRNDPDTLNKVSRNNLVVDVYEPGSTFKIITSAANIEEYLSGNPKAFSPAHVFNSSRYRYIDGQKIKCWSNHANGKHSALNLSGALNNSCNPIFVDIACSLGLNTFYRYVEAFNFGKVTGIDFIGEAQGMVLPYSSVQNVDLARIGFGQTIAVSALQLAAAVGSAVNGGEYYSPFLVSEIYTSDGRIAEKFYPKMKNRTVSKKASRILNEMLEDVVANGSGKHAYVENCRVAGKTGTAQKYENGVIASGKYVASFIGYFPADAPLYLALVIVDEPEGQYYGSTVAAPYAKELFQGIVNTKK